MINEKALGPEHPHVAASLNNLAALYQAQGRYAEAEPLYRRSLEIGEKALGPEHPNVAQSLENYAALLRETGRTAEADKMEARAKAIRAASGLRSTSRIRLWTDRLHFCLWLQAAMGGAGGNPAKPT